MSAIDIHHQTYCILLPEGLGRQDVASFGSMKWDGGH